jgi:tetratricopeptide (TPR) repeat protein
MMVVLIGNPLILPGQEVPESYRKTIDSLIDAMPKTYNEIDEVLNASRADTTMMRYFAKRSEAKNYYEGQAYAFNQIGRKYRDISQFSKSFILHQKAFDAAEKAKSVEFEIFSLNMISVVFRRTDAIKAALDYSQKALELAEAVKNPSEGIKRSINVSLNGIGNIYLTLGQYDLAIEQFKESMKLEEALGNKLGLAINNQNIGECYEKLGKLDDALNSFKTSLAYNEEINSDKGRVICKNSIAQVYIKKGDSKKAVEILEPILVQAEALSDKDIISLIHINLGWSLMNLKRYAEAENHLNKGLEMAKKYNIPSNISAGNDFLSELYSLKGDYKKALEYFKNARHFEDEIANDRNLRYVNDMITRYESEKKSAQLEMVSKENEINKLKLRKNNATLLISGIILALLAGIFYVLYRQYQLKNEKKLLTLEQSMLRSQMNPHFLFNSLNSIKLYIINNEKKNAVHYLNKFSKLVRKILEASSLKEISLEDELETVELYMNIENIRFSNEINFKVIIDKDIDVHAVKIPSLILQPFLENALWHGLSSKEGEKNIELEVTRGADGFINISITDNGVGREVSEKIKESKVLKRKSIGIDITKERLANFSRDYLNSFNVQILDLYDEGHRSTGTKVILHIPTI